MDKQIQPTDLDEINAKLVELSASIYPENMQLKYVSVSDLREQTENPRSMPQKMFDQLIENIKNAGTLESIPLCVYVDNQIEIISGHHRVRAARAAGVKHILVLMYTDLPRSRLRSKQLAHNTISGVDDPEMIRRVWNQIQDVQAQFEAYVDPRVLSAVPEPVKFKPVDVSMKAVAKTVLIVFLPTQKLDFDQAVEAILPKTETDAIYLAQAEIYDAWKESLAKVREECDIVSAPTAIAEMARLAVECLERRKAEKQADSASIQADA